MLRSANLVRTNVSEELRASVIILRRIGELGTLAAIGNLLLLLVTANVVPISTILFPLIMEAIRSYETPVLKKATLHNIPEDSELRDS
jgi:hypothetical protein